MNLEFSSVAEPIVAQQLKRAIVSAVHDDGSIEVDCAGVNLLCDVLWTAAGAVPAEPNDAVLVMVPGTDAARGLIIGRIGPAQVPSVTQEAAATDALPAELVLEARESLTLRVGEGSITIRADGKILIKGKDLVSHAQRVNRIRGGSVAIN